MSDKEEYVLLETTATGNLFSVGSILIVGGDPVFWRDIDSSKFLFKKGDYTAIFQDDCVIKYLKTADVKDLYFRDFRNKKIYKTSLDQFLNVKSRNMRGRMQRGVSLSYFNEVEIKNLPENRRPENKIIISI